MGCDIHSFVEIKIDGKWRAVREKFLDHMRTYRLFGWLAGVKNYSAVQPLSGPKGMPKDASELVKHSHISWGSDGHSHSWFTLEELLQVDYEQEVEDRRITMEVSPNFFDGGCTSEEGQGKKMKLKYFLGELFMDKLEEMKQLSNNPKETRLVFWFDN